MDSAAERENRQKTFPKLLLKKWYIYLTYFFITSKVLIFSTLLGVSIGFGLIPLIGTLFWAWCLLFAAQIIFHSSISWIYNLRNKGALVFAYLAAGTSLILMAMVVAHIVAPVVGVVGCFAVFFGHKSVRIFLELRAVYLEYIGVKSRDKFQFFKRQLLRYLTVILDYIGVSVVAGFVVAGIISPVLIGIASGYFLLVGLLYLIGVSLAIFYPKRRNQDDKLSIESGKRKVNKPGVLNQDKLAQEKKLTTLNSDETNEPQQGDDASKSLN